jgi:hypothetical protein
LRWQTGLVSVTGGWVGYSAAARLDLAEEVT